MIEDSLPVGEVGSWVREKHDYLKRYINISRKTRLKYMPPLGRGGATYTDLFCGAGRANIRNTDQIVDGSALTAWRASVEGGALFTKVYVCDHDPVLLDACVKRLQLAEAPVQGFCMSAVDAASQINEEIQSFYPYGLHFAFIDPFNLEQLDFDILDELADIKRMDLLIHLSVMDLQRNLKINLQAEESAFDLFAPGWRDSVDAQGTQTEVRRRVVEFWRSKVESLGLWPSLNHRLITGDKLQPLYWLLLAARHELAHDFWDVASNPEGQGNLFG